MIPGVLLLACVIPTGYSPTPMLRWDLSRVCPCTLAACPREEGYRLTWATSTSGPWHELVRLPCVPAFDEDDDHGGIAHHPRWCWGVDHDVPVSRWLPATAAGTEVFFRVDALSATGVPSCAPTTLPSVCWPLIREIP